jgi:hypothetical protein
MDKSRRVTIRLSFGQDLGVLVEKGDFVSGGDSLSGDAWLGMKGKGARHAAVSHPWR